MIWNREDLAWAAGLFEGEGCVSRYITTKRSREYKYWHVRLGLTDPDVLRRFRDVIGFGRIYRQKTQKGCKPAEQWTCYVQNEVYAVLAALYQFMGERRRTKMWEALVDIASRPPIQLKKSHPK